MEDFYVDVLKDIPSYRKILKVVLKSQIQLLVQQLFEHTGEETVLISANVDNKNISHLGSDAGKAFISNCEDVKSKFLDFCIHRSTQENLKSQNEKPGVPVTRKPYNRLASRFTKIRDRRGINIVTRSNINNNQTYPRSINQTQAKPRPPSNAGSGNATRSLPTYPSLRSPEGVMKSAKKVDLVFIQDKKNANSGTIKRTISIKEAELTPEQREDLMSRGVELTPSTVVVKQEPQDDDEVGLNNEEMIDCVTVAEEIPLKTNDISTKMKQGQSSIGCQSDFDETDQMDLAYNTGSASTVGQTIYENEYSTFDKSSDEGLNWSLEQTPTGSGNTRSPQVDGVLVSRGFGRYEKLIRCERCSKVCRTSNMARHKKKYCDNILKKRAEKEMNMVQVHGEEIMSQNIYIDNPMESSIDSASDLNNSDPNEYTEIKMADFDAGKENNSTDQDEMSTVIVKQEPGTF